LDKIVEGFFPETYRILGIREKTEGYEFNLLSTSSSACCPQCGLSNSRAHSFQERSARDLPILGKPVLLEIIQKRYFCDNKNCETDIFTERNGIINHYSQFTTRCREYMLAVAVHVSCEAAVKILAYQGIRVSGDTLLNMLKAAGNDYKSEIGKKIGIDDWAFRRGQTYGTIICDLETHDIIDVLKGRDAETLEKWLGGHQDIDMVSRDRASAYASAVSNVLPEAVQIADRFHITKNLLEALKETMKSFMPEVIEVPNDEAVEPVTGKPGTRIKKTPKRSSVKKLK